MAITDGCFLYSFSPDRHCEIGLRSARFHRGVRPESVGCTPNNPEGVTSSCSPIAVEGLLCLYAILQRLQDVPELLVVQAWPCLEDRMTPFQPTATKVRWP